MLRYFFLLLIFVVSLSALSDRETLNRADKLLNSSSKSEKFRAYSDYKNLYLRSIMNDDRTLKIKSLKGIVKSAKTLNIDASQYVRELKKLEKKSSKRKVKSSKSKGTGVHVLKNARWRGSDLLLKFDSKLQSSQVKYFTMYNKKNRHYKYVFDIKNSVLQRNYNLGNKKISRVRIAQYKSTIVRLVLEDNKKLNIKFKRENNALVVMFKKSSLKSHKSYVKKEPLYSGRVDSDKVIVIDAGHGGKDPGAIGYKRYREKTIVMSIAKELKSILNARGYRVYLTRSGDKFIKLSNRTKYANRKNADIFISIHANAVPKKDALKTHGIECYFLAKSRSSRAKEVASMENSADLSDMNFYGKESFLNTLGSHNIVASNKLAIDLQRGMLGSLKKSYRDVHDAGVREGPFWVLVGAQMPSVLVEVGFVTHPKEASRLVSSRYQKKLALGLANGVERYFINN
jgi:N-acetylmuramoyl-L-alanine amidase